MPRSGRVRSPPAAPNKTRLSHFAITNLKPKERPSLVWDIVQHSLAVSVQTSGHAAWKPFIHFMVGRVGITLRMFRRSAWPRPASWRPTSCIKLPREIDAPILSNQTLNTKQVDVCIATGEAQDALAAEHLRRRQWADIVAGAALFKAHGIFYVELQT
jgi:hypothetical protein